MVDKNSFRVINCFDSHLHLLATGQVQRQLNLTKLSDISEIGHLYKNYLNTQAVANNSLVVNTQWLFGFGWNQENWQKKNWPTQHDINSLFLETPVFLSRVDGHASLLNAPALQFLKDHHFNFDLYSQYEVLRDEKNQLTGVLKDRAHIEALALIKQFAPQHLEDALTLAAQLINKAGVTHVRDMSMSYEQWKYQKKLAEAKKIFLYTEAYITAESVNDLQRAYDEYKKCAEDQCEFLKIKGLKIFIDGSLGSETAYLSKPYQNSNSNGLLLWKPDEIKEAIRFCWSRKVDIAVHAIGDQAAHELALAARSVSAEGYLGQLHIEHAQVFRKETFNILKPLHFFIHMQPCHWLSDHSWLKSKIGDLEKSSFLWEFFRKNNVALTFGSDSPIEPVSILRNLQVFEILKTKKIKIPENLNDDPLKFHSYAHYNKTAWGETTTTFYVGENNEFSHCEIDFNQHKIKSYFS